MKEKSQIRVVALIPIKLGSARVPGKNIKPFFDGTPLIHFIQRVCLKSSRINEIYVYCSDESINKYLLPGIKLIKRPAYLNGDDIKANDIVKEFMKVVSADIYVKAHATSPFAKVETIDACIDKVISGEHDSAFCAENVKAFMWKDGKPINFEPDSIPRTQDLPSIYAETSIAYVFSKETFAKHNRIVGVNPYICNVGKIEAIDIDYPEDFVIADAIYKEVIKKL